MVRVILGPLERLGTDQRRAWAAPRVWAAHQAPYMASALLALDPVVVDQSDEAPSNRLDLGGLPVDQQWHVYLDPDVLAEMTVPTIGFWLVHQVSHLLRHHAARSPVRDPAGRTTRPRTQSDGEQRWNAAADAEINDDLVAGNTARPEEAVTPSTLGLPDSWTAEQYWDALGGSDTDDGSHTDDGRDADDGSHVTEPGERAAGAAGRGHDCGSGCDGSARPWDSGEPGLGASGQKLLERDVARRIEEHQRRYGTTPARWRRWAAEILEPTVSWQRLLASAIRRGVADVAGRVDFSYRKPSRRSSLGGDVILPSLRQPLPKVAMVLDTSGSMNDHLLAQSLAEVDGVLRGLGVGRRHLQIVCCDAQAFEAQKAAGGPTWGRGWRRPPHCGPGRI
jgi:hypothetical protein